MSAWLMYIIIISSIIIIIIIKQLLYGEKWL